MGNEVIQLKVQDKDGVLKNISDFIEEYRKDNVECLFLSFRRKDGSGTRTFFVGGDNPHMFKLLERLKHDLLELYAEDVTYINTYGSDEEED